MSTDVFWHHHQVSCSDRAVIKNQQAVVIWFTGLSASGKSTIAGVLEQMLFNEGHHTYLLDGDNIRHGVCDDLGFTEADRVENIRRVGEIAKLMCDAGLITLAALISPFRSDRDMVRAQIPDAKFIEVFIDAPLETCIERDPKGLYEKAMRGEIAEFTGIDSPYEAPESPEIHLNTSELSVTQCVYQIMFYLNKNGLLSHGSSTLARLA